MKFLYTVLLLSASLCASSQNPDSLLGQFRDESLDMTTRLSGLHRYARYQMYRSPDTALHYAQLEETLAREHGMSKTISGALNLQGGALTAKGDFVGALDRFARSLDIRIAIRDTQGIAASLNNIGNVFYYKGDYVNALKYFKRSIDHEELTDNKRGLAASYLNIGTVAAELENNSEAIDYFQKSLELYREAGDSTGVGNTCVNLGTAYMAIDSLDKAEHYFARSIALLRNSADEIHIAEVYINKAKIAKLKKDPAQLHACYNNAEQILSEAGDTKGLSALKIHRGIALISFANYRAAIEECSEGLEIAENYDIKVEMRNGCECLYLAYRAQGREDMALPYLERMNVIDDTIARAEASKELGILEFRQRVEADSLRRLDEKALLAKQHSEQIKEVSNRRNLYFGIGIAFLLLSVFLYMAMRKSNKARKTIEARKDRSDNVLLNILPFDVARELVETGKVDAREFSNVTVLFTDFVGFTDAAEKMPPKALVDSLNSLYHHFDEIIEKYRIQKIKTIGDSYMAAGGLPSFEIESVKNTVLAALEMQHYISTMAEQRRAKGLQAFDMRCGIHHGPVVAGIVGKKTYQYDIWGHTVNVASRLESVGDTGRVNISGTIYRFIADDRDFAFESRGKVEIKGTEPVEMWFVDHAEKQ